MGNWNIWQKLDANGGILSRVQKVPCPERGRSLTAARKVESACEPMDRSRLRSATAVKTGGIARQFAHFFADAANVLKPMPDEPDH